MTEELKTLRERAKGHGYRLEEINGCWHLVVDGPEVSYSSLDEIREALDASDHQRQSLAKRRVSDLMKAIGAFPPSERTEAIASALRQVEQEERRQFLMERFNKLSPEGYGDGAIRYCPEIHPWKRRETPCRTPQDILDTRPF
jgi:hypothetical protein